jgi:hypothetical protein
MVKSLKRGNKLHMFVIIVIMGIFHIIYCILLIIYYIYIVYCVLYIVYYIIYHIVIDVIYHDTYEHTERILLNISILPL